MNGPTMVLILRVRACLHTNKGTIFISKEPDRYDFNVEALTCSATWLVLKCALPFLAAFSAIRRTPARPGMLVVGDMSIQENIKAAKSLVEPLQVAMDNGARCALSPAENKRSFMEVNIDVLERIDPIIYNDIQTATLKGLGMI